MLKLWSRGQDVTRLQMLLNERITELDALDVDGVFGKGTSERVKEFQRRNGLVADGIVGAKTWEKLEQKAVSRATQASSTVQKSNWLKIAMAEKDIKENALPGKHTRRILDYHATTTLKAQTDEVPWCSSFVNWVMLQAGYKGTNNALAKSWLDWGVKVEKPVPGTVVIIKRKNKNSDRATGSSTGYHVAFFISQTDRSIRLLGGNQGDSVKMSNFMLRSYEVVGYRKPVQKTTPLAKRHNYMALNHVFSCFPS